MQIFKRTKTLCAVLLSVVLLGVPLSVQAAPVLTITEGLVTNTVTLTPVVAGLYLGSGSVGDYTVSVSVNDSSSPGSDLISQASFAVTTKNKPAGSLIMTLSDNFSNSLGSPVKLTNSLSTTQVSKGSVSGFSFLNAGVTAPLTFATVNSGTTTNVLATGGGATFLLGNTATISGLTGTLQAPGVDNFTLTTTADTITPEPTSVVVALTALPFVGIGIWVRRRKAKVAA